MKTETTFLQSLAGTLSAVCLLNLALTFQNIWPTPWIRPTAELSAEIAGFLLILALSAEWRGPLGRRSMKIATAALFLLVLGRYADVTAPALFGRRMNLYWDVPYLPDVAAMLVAAAPPWKVAAAAIGVIAGIAVVVVALCWSIRALNQGFTMPVLRRGTAAAAAAAIGFYLAGISSDRISTGAWFALPVTPVYLRQVADLLAQGTSRAIERDAMRSSDIGRLNGADVYLIFLESYGATVFDELDGVRGTAPSFAALDRFLRSSGWQVASAFVESPTFGGASWLAHASLLSGLRIADQRDYQTFMASRRETLVDRFRQAGYRTVALLPGTKRAWPEGAALGFDRIYDAAALDYRGPAFGWWTIPDQYTLERLYQSEIMVPSRQPLFVLFATIMSHMPFSPIPPYQPEWSRFDTASPYDASRPASEPNEETQAADLGSAYLSAIRYDIDLLSGFLRQRAPRDALVIVAGDHQPPAIVSRANASWSVPVHIFTQSREILGPFIEAGFCTGLVPERPSIGGMEDLTHLFLEAFDGDAQDRGPPAPCNSTMAEAV